jgi:hypothetical protein
LLPPGRIVIQSALLLAPQLQAAGVVTEKESAPPAAPNDWPVGDSEYVHGVMNVAAIDTAALPEFTVRGLLVVAEPPLTVAELNTYCAPPMV